MEQKKIRNVGPSIGQLIIRDLGKYGGNSGVNKLFHLLCVIDNLTTHLGEDYVIEEVEKELKRLKEFEEKTQQVTVYKRIGNWEKLRKRLDFLRPKLGAIQFAYDDIKRKNKKKEINYKKLVKRVSPYQIELYWFFNLLMKISDEQSRTIPSEAFATHEQTQYLKKPFIKPKPVSQDIQIYHEN